MKNAPRALLDLLDRQIGERAVRRHDDDFRA